MYKNKLFKLRSIPIALASVMLVPSASYAAEETDEDEDEGKKITIVGSHIKRSTIEGPSPVQVFDLEDIAKSGQATLQQLVERMPAAGAGSFSTRGNSQDSTGNGGAAISLRGFGADATLVLINGRRANISAFAESVVNNFVDINSIPLAAIERVEILKDGASAIYGSDAVSGVVNIELRKDYVGSEVTVGYGSTTKSSADETQISGLFGFGDGKTNGTFIFDHFSTGELRNSDRGRLGTANQEPLGGFDLRSSRGFPGRYIVNGQVTIDPDCPADRAFGQTCVYDYGPFGFLIPEMDRTGAMFLYNSEVSTDLQLFFEVSAQRNTSQAGGAATPLDGDAGLTAPATHPNNPFGVDIDIDRHRTVDAGPRVFDIQSESLRFVTGLEGVINDFDWQVSLTKARSLSLQTGNRSQGWVRTDFLQREIDAGRYNPFGGTINPQSVIDDITTSLTRRGESRLTAVEGKFSGELFEMASGYVAMAAGFEYRKESVKDIPDDQFQRGLIFGTESVSAQASRDHWSVFTEFSLPLSDTLELQLAGRYDDYELAGTSTNPKIAVHWRPTDDIALRASWGTGFRAPSLAQIGLGPSEESRFFSDPFCADVPACVASGGAATDLTINFSGNPDLKPEESESFNVGLIWDLSENLNLSVDYWNITQDEKIDEDDVGSAVLRFCDPNGVIDPTRCTRNPITNELLEVSNSYINIASQEASGLDVSANYKMETGIGDLTFGLDWTFLNNFERERPEFNPNDPANPTIITRDWTGEYEFPEIRWNGRVEWSVDNMSATAIVNYIGEFQDQPDSDLDGTVDFEQNDTRTVDSMMTLDLQFAIDVGDSTTYSFGSTNLLDEEVPFAIGDGNNDLFGYVQGVHDPRGRFVYARATFRF
ncbi:TonB-dependent receptor [Aliikangiella coralliicola]|uniref:TonB-dependent receptor n=1 Tax=Aliikangiella coralliicola TaxID=2592383 RepID=A0A545UBJ6_9GAMM|nr:TonB-dependent receptor [Aliikangiella coralliicola]TQV86838.1 TonB-dependent receptor [Aliikangiella coralliicola]